MKERPILFSAPMVRAILEGRKTQTRRIVKFPDGDFADELSSDLAKNIRVENGSIACDWIGGIYSIPVKCPHGKPGDRLYVRETWGHTGTGVWSVRDAQMALDGRVIYAATDPAPCKGCWFPSIHMPRRFSRITLELTDVLVERLNDISEENARAEGIKDDRSAIGSRTTIIGSSHNETCRNCGGARISHIGQSMGCFGKTTMYDPTSFRGGFSMLWESINGAGSWDANPWVWAESFKVLA